MGQDNHRMNLRKLYTKKNGAYLRRMRKKNEMFCRYSRYCKEMGFVKKRCNKKKENKCKRYEQYIIEMRTGVTTGKPAIAKVKKKGEEK